MTTLPTLDEDLFAVQALQDPYPLYRRLRDLGPVVQLAAQGMPAVGRYDGVRAVLADHETFVSGQGVFWNPLANELTAGTTLASDPPEHAELRRLVAHRLTPRALRGQKESIEAKADALVAGVLARGGVVDAIPEIAVAMPMSVVPDFIGFPEECRPNLVPWAKGALEVAAPVSERTPQAVPLAVELGEYTESLVGSRSALPGSLGADLLTAADRGEVAIDRCPALMIDYFGPSLETTLSALGSALALFAQHPQQWDRLRADLALAPGAFNEVLRVETPLRAFTRVAIRDTRIDGVDVPAGTRIGVFFASANRDERKWDRPDEFDITRDNADHLALGYGEHGCAGQGLARLEVNSVLTSLARSVARIELAGEPVITVHSLVRSYSSLPVRLIPA